MELLYPKSLNIETTSICNLKCVMCTQSAEDFGRSKIHLSENFLEQLKPYIINCDSIQLHGIGEPTLSPSFWKCLSFLSKKSWSSTNTNLVNVSDEKMIEMVNSNLKHLSVSIDSPNENTYYKIRGSNLKQVIKNIKKLIDYKEKYKSNLLIGLNMTLMRENILELKDAVDLCVDLNLNLLDTWPLNNWEGEKFNRQIRNWNFNYEDQLPWKFQELYNNEIDKILIYTSEKNIRFTYHKI
jgi:MoaA/NifB/PqqE/SkfB family radical SAM enzyme